MGAWPLAANQVYRKFKGAKMRKQASFLNVVWLCVGLLIILGIYYPAQAQVGVPKYVVDPTWPKPLPGVMVTGRAGGICVDAQDHVFEVNRGDLQDKELSTGTPAPVVLEYDPDGNLVNSWGDGKTTPKSPHGCFVDNENNFWFVGNQDGVAQKWTHDGSKLLLQIGTKGVFDSSTGLFTGRPMNRSHTSLFNPADVVTDPTNGDVYVADGYGNRRIVVFDKTGNYLRQWGSQGTNEEEAAGNPGVFMDVVHCVRIGNDGLVYVCDRHDNRIEVFDKMGNFKRNIWVKTKCAECVNYPEVKTPDPTNWGTTWWIQFSHDPAQKLLYVADGLYEQVHVLDRETGNEIAHFGRPGHQIGEFDHCHTMAVDSKENIYIAETDWGKRVQKFKLVK
jgi:DNA-binding beta-propeller fold protein YncE